MIETCINCKFYCSALSDDKSDYHIHDYCIIWRTQIPDGVIFNRENCASGHTDIECGLTKCWAFLPKDEAKQETFPSINDNEKWSDYADESLYLCR